MKANSYRYLTPDVNDATGQAILYDAGGKDSVLKMKTVHVIIAGKVQGVFFRDYTLQKAKELGVKGWVRNLPNGSVEAMIEGQPASVDGMIEWFYRGSPLSLVSDVQVDEILPTETLSDFAIRYS